MTHELFLPGPCALPPRVRRAVGGEMINPRGAEFAELLAECEAGMRAWLETDHDVLFMAASGTGALEGAVANLLQPGRAGAVRRRWAGSASCGCGSRRPTAPTSCASTPAGATRSSRPRWPTRSTATPTVRKVFLTHNETSTGVRNDIEALAAVVKDRGLLLAVDAISGAPGHPLAVDALRADVVLVGSQKGWLAPPGLAMVAVSPAALARRRGGHHPALLLRLRAPAARPGARAHAHHRAAARRCTGCARGSRSCAPRAARRSGSATAASPPPSATASPRSASRRSPGPASRAAR